MTFILRSPSVKLSLLLFCLLLSSYGYFFHSGGANSNVRFSHVRALAEHQSNRVDHFRYNSHDIIVVNGKRYSNKPPGLVYVGVIPWMISDRILTAVGIEENLRHHFNCYSVQLATVGVVSALGSVALFWIATTLLSSASLALLLTIAYALGTIAFPFSTVFFSHQFTASLLFLSFSLLFYLRTNPSDHEGKNAVRPMPSIIAGLLAGYPFVCEYPALIGTGVLFLYGTIVLKNRAELLRFLIGIFIGVLPLFLYNYFVFDDLFFLTYGVDSTQNNPSYHYHRIGFFGLELFSIANLYGLTFGAFRGLFYCNPWLLSLFPAVAALHWCQEHRLERALCGVLFLLFLFFAAGLTFWHGGDAIGPRYLIPALPFAAVFVAPTLKVQWIRRILFFAIVVSIFFMLIATGVDPTPGKVYLDPLFDYHLPRFQQGYLSESRNGVFSNSLITSNSVSFNIGKLLGLPPALQLQPLFFSWILFLILIVRNIENQSGVWLSRRTLFSCAAGVLCFWLCITVPPLYVRFSEGALRDQGVGLEGSFIRGIRWKSPSPTWLLYPIADQEGATTRLYPSINFQGDPSEGKFSRPYSAEWRGDLFIEEQGEYHFKLISDDGSALLLDYKIVVSNWGNHARRAKEGSIKLEEGYHSVLLRYYNVAAGGVLELQWKTPGSDRFEHIPSKYLQPPK